MAPESAAPASCAPVSVAPASGSDEPEPTPDSTRARRGAGGRPGRSAGATPRRSAGHAARRATRGGARRGSGSAGIADDDRGVQRRAPARRAAGGVGRAARRQRETGENANALRHDGLLNLHLPFGDGGTGQRATPTSSVLFHGDRCGRQRFRLIDRDVPVSSGRARAGLSRNA